MISSLISLYLASAVQAEVLPTIKETPEPNTVKAATFELSELSATKKIPLKDPVYIAPIVEARGALAMDLDTGALLLEKNIHERLQIASITKLMTVLIIIEENQLDEMVKVSPEAAAIEGSTMSLIANEEISVENLLYGVLINSANDAATALAEHNAGNVDEFVEKMNQKALSLGLINTHYSNPVGLDSKYNYSSAYDIAKLSQYIYKKPFVQQAVSIQNMEVFSKDQKYKHQLKTTNKLLSNEHYTIKGLKTGKTNGAGLCLVAIAEDKNGNEFLTIVLNSPDRFEESKILIDWILRAYTWQN